MDVLPPFNEASSFPHTGRTPTVGSPKPSPAPSPPPSERTVTVRGRTGMTPRPSPSPRPSPVESPRPPPVELPSPLSTYSIKTGGRFDMKKLTKRNPQPQLDQAARRNGGLTHLQIEDDGGNHDAGEQNIDMDELHPSLKGCQPHHEWDKLGNWSRWSYETPYETRHPKFGSNYIARSTSISRPDEWPMLHSVKNNPSDIQLNERTMIERSNRKWKEEITQMKKIYSDTENLKYQTMPISSNCSRRRDEAQDRENVSHLHPDIHSEIEMQKVEDEKEREADLFKWKEAGKRSSVMNKLVSNEELPEYMKRLMSTKNWTYNAHFSNEYHLRNRKKLLQHTDTFLCRVNVVSSENVHDMLLDDFEAFSIREGWKLVSPRNSALISRDSGRISAFFPSGSPTTSVSGAFPSVNNAVSNAGASLFASGRKPCKNEMNGHQYADFVGSIFHCPWKEGIGLTSRSPDLAAPPPSQEELKVKVRDEVQLLSPPKVRRESSLELFLSPQTETKMQALLGGRDPSQVWFAEGLMKEDYEAREAAKREKEELEKSIARKIRHEQLLLMKYKYGIPNARVKELAERVAVKMLPTLAKVNFNRDRAIRDTELKGLAMLSTKYASDGPGAAASADPHPQAWLDQVEGETAVREVPFAVHMGLLRDDAFQGI